MGSKKVFAEQDWKDILEPDNACPSELLPCSGSLPWNPNSMDAPFHGWSLLPYSSPKDKKGSGRSELVRNTAFFHYL